MFFSYSAFHAVRVADRATRTAIDALGVADAGDCSATRAVRIRDFDDLRWQSKLVLHRTCIVHCCVIEGVTMKHVISVVFLILGVASVGYVQAERYEGDGAWAVFEYGKGTTLILALEIFRENPDKGARPAFMVNYGDKDGCFVSFGLAMLSNDIPKRMTRLEVLSGLKQVIEQSDFLADSEVLAKRDGRVQALDMGGIIYARALIDTDVLAAFMLAKDGAIRVRNKDASIMFDMYGFKDTITTVLDNRCK